MEHQDHNKISLDQGLENIKSEIGIRVHEAQENRSRMRSYKVSLEKRRMKVNGSIEGKPKELSVPLQPSEAIQKLGYSEV